MRFNYAEKSIQLPRSLQPTLKLLLHSAILYPVEKKTVKPTRLQHFKTYPRASSINRCTGLQRETRNRSAPTHIAIRGTAALTYNLINHRVSAASSAKIPVTGACCAVCVYMCVYVLRLDRPIYPLSRGRVWYALARGTIYSWGDDARPTRDFFAC